MADDIGLYWSLFQGEFPDEWKSDPDFALYLSQLSSLSVEKLQLEPEHLREERRCVLNSTQKLAFNNYMTFIQTAECTREVFKDFVAVEDHVTKLLDKIPEFSTACKKFAKDSQDINAKRKLNSLALSKHTQLLEILEIPQVMETCVRNGYYEEALDLNTHVRRIDKKHGEIPIVKAIAKDVGGSMELMLSQLLQQLRVAIQLPACLKVVGFLRRMEVFSDVELRLKFLQARDAWLQSVLSAVATDDPYHHISKTIEASRVHLFDVVTQYRAIFPDDDSVRVTYSSQPKGEGPVQGALFYSWVNDKIWQFLCILEEDLQQGVGGRMDSVLSQCMYFGLSFSRIGADFRSLIAPVFVRVLASSFRRSLRDAKHVFHESIKRMTLTSPLRGLTTPTSSNPLSLSTSSSLSPPHTLLDFPPLAHLTNALVHAFNELRQCAPLSLAPSIAQELRRLLESTVHDIGEYYRFEHNSFSQQEMTAFNQLVRVIVRDLLPFIKRVFTNMFAEKAVEQLALSTPYALRHTKKSPSAPSSSSSLPSLEGGGQLTRTNRAGVDLGMGLDMENLAEPLRRVAAKVFEEMEEMKRQEFAATVDELHHQSSEAGGAGDGGGGGDCVRGNGCDGGGGSDGNESDGVKGGGGAGDGDAFATSKTTQDENESIDLGGIVLKRSEFGRPKKEEGEHSVHLLQDGGITTQENQQETKNNGGHLEAAATAYRSFKSQESDHSVILTSSIGRAVDSSGLDGAGLQQPSPPRQLLTSERLGKETERTVNVLQHSALAKDKAT